MAEEQSRLEKAVVRAPRTFEQSEKSKKTVDSMIEKRNGEKPNKKPSKKKEGKFILNSFFFFLSTNVITYNIIF